MKPLNDKQQLISLNELLALHKARYTERKIWLFRLHMLALIPWLVFRHAIVQPIAKYIEDFVAEQNGDIRYRNL